MTLLEILKENRWTITEFAKRINVSRQYLYRVAEGKKKPSKELVEKMALLLQTSQEKVRKAIREAKNQTKN